MKTTVAGEADRTGSLAAVLMGYLIGTAALAYTESSLHPAWWDARNVITTHTNEFINDRAPANQGQVKWFALQAYEEFNEKLPGAGNAGIRQRIDGFTDQNNYLSVNIGQLKNVVAPCYDRLAEYGLAGSYPWEGDQALMNDYAIATVGQLKEFFAFELPTGPTRYYVATDGSDENPGTIDQPFQTIQHAVNQVIPGDTVLIRAGTYREQVTLTISGTPEQPITIMGYGDEYPTIKGSDVVTNWVHYKNNIWMVTNWTINCQQVFENGVPLQQIGYPHQVFKDNPSWYNLVGLGIEDMLPGSFFRDPDASRLYVWLANESAPPIGGLEVSTKMRPFHGGGSAHIRLDRLNFRHSNYPWFGAVILGDHSLMRNCDIQWCDFIGVFMSNNSSVIDCNISNNGDTGIGGNIATNLLVRGCTITNNNYRLFNPNWHAGGIKLGPDVSATVENNIVAWNNGHGIWFDYCNDNPTIIIRNNYVHHNRTGIFVEVSPGAVVYNNVVLSNSEGICVAESSNVQVFNNTVADSYGFAAIRSSAAYSRISSGMPFFGNRFINNLLYKNASTYDLFLPAPSEYIWDNQSDYNCIYRSDGTPRFGGYGGTVSGLGNWQLASGQDVHSQQGHPRMLNPPFSNYDLSTESPCIDVGTNLTEFSSIPYDYSGRPRIANGIVDIGAYEFNEFEGQTQPEIRVTTPTSVIPNDQDTLTGILNANVKGFLTAAIVSDGTTNWVSVTNTSLYSWTLDISDFEIGQEYMITIYGTNSVGSLEQQTVMVMRGDVGTGTPTVSITTLSPIILPSGTALLSGTNNVHVAGQMSWSNRYNNVYTTGGSLAATDGTWILNMDGLYPGRNEIHVFGTNDWGVEASDHIQIDYGSTTNHYVAIDSPDPTYPFISWHTAAQSIQEAIEAASDGDTVYVTNGVYQAGWTEHETGRTRVIVDKGIRLQSVNGPEHTTIRGNKEYPWPPYSRCITLDHIEADLAGFTLREGYANGLTYGGGALILNMNIMSNCIVSDCYSPGSGGGVCLWGANGKGNGFLTSSIISGNRTSWSGGGIAIQWGSKFKMENCIISNNTSLHKGGGMVIDNCVQVRNCLVVHNDGSNFGGGIVLGNGSKMHNCTIENNTASRGGGVSFDATAGRASIYNSIFHYNVPDNFSAERLSAGKPYTVEYCFTTALPPILTSTEGSMTHAPQYLYPHGGDYRLASQSPCINGGATFDWMVGSMALNNTNRILFGQPDIGCYEFEGQTQPEIRVTTPTSVIPNDQDTLTGILNANVKGFLTAAIVSDGTTNWVSVTNTSLYSWTLDISDFEIGQEYMITIYGTNSVGSLEQQTVMVMRGDVGTGTPTVSITTLSPIILPSGTALLSGTNNVHVAGQMSWSNRYNNVYTTGGSLAATDGTWILNMDGLYPGRNEIHVFGTNDWGVEASDHIQIDYGSTTNHYVAIDSPDPTYPFISWHTAAQSIQEAIEAASDGDTVYVTNGVYQAGWTEHETGRTRVIVDKGIRLQSVNGPEHTTIRGNKEYPWPPYSRCITLDHIEADLAGFTLREGYANGLTYGGGALILNMNIMSNCIVSDCYSPGSGGGVCLWGANGKGNGFLTSSIISGNRTSWSGGGIAIQWGSKFKMENCIISNNTSLHKGGGMVIDNCVQVRNCLVVHNDGSNFGGGIVLGNGSKMHNCTIENNTASRGGGVSFDATAGRASIYNSIFHYNVPDNFSAERLSAGKPYTVEYCFTTALPPILTSTEGSMTHAPQYLYPHGGDYRLASQSPCINGGATFDWMVGSMALNNTNRILFGQPDIGCYEFDDSPELLLPLVEVFSPTGWLPYDESTYIVYGGRNMNTRELQATITTNGITNNLNVNLSGNYDWDLDPTELIPEITNTFTVTGWNMSSNSAEQVFTVIRGGIGTGLPVITITNAPTSISTNTQVIISGTNNVHVMDPGVWELSDQAGVIDSGTLSLTHQTWQLAFTNLNAGIYSLEVGSTNLWGVSAGDHAEFEVF